MAGSHGKGFNRNSNALVQTTPNGPKHGDRDPIVDFGRGMYNWQVSIIHIDSGVGASFPAFITDYSETFNSDWNEDNYFGRNDKIGRHSGTSRTISLSLDLPSFSANEARLNMHQIEHLITTMYPSYESVGPEKNSSHVLKSYPLVRVKFANLIKKGSVQNDLNPKKSGLAGWIPNLTINPDLEAGFHSIAADQKNWNTSDKKYYHHEDPKGGLLYPKLWKMSFSLRVVHEHKLGWQGMSDWMSERKRFPWGAYAGFTEGSTDFGTAVVTTKLGEESAAAAVQDIFAPPKAGEEF